MLASVSAATNCRYFFISVVWSTTVGLGAGTNAMVAGGRTGLLWGKGADRSLHRAQCDLMNTVETTGNKRSAVVNLNEEIKVILAQHVCKNQRCYGGNRCLTNKPATDTNMPLNRRTIMTSLQASASSILCTARVFLN